MNNTIIFAEPFESKLNKLRVKRAFVKNFKKAYGWMDLNKAIEVLNSQETFEAFIIGSFYWEATYQGNEFWKYISKQ